MIDENQTDKELNQGHVVVNAVSPALSFTPVELSIDVPTIDIGEHVSGVTSLEHIITTEEL